MSNSPCVLFLLKLLLEYNSNQNEVSPKDNLYYTLNQGGLPLYQDKQFKLDAVIYVKEHPDLTDRVQIIIFRNSKFAVIIIILSRL